MLKFVIVARTPRWSIRVKLYTGKAVGVNDVCVVVATPLPVEPRLSYVYALCNVSITECRVEFI